MCDTQILQAFMRQARFAIWYRRLKAVLMLIAVLAGLEYVIGSWLWGTRSDGTDCLVISAEHGAK